MNGYLLFESKKVTATNWQMDSHTKLVMTTTTVLLVC